jgi:IS6 family transposase
VKVAGQWRYVYRAVDQFGQVIDVYVASRRDATAARRFFDRATTTTRTRPVEVVTDRAATYPIVLNELLPAAWHRTDRYANNRIEADHGRLKARLRSMRGLKRDRRPGSPSPGTPLVQNVRRGHYELPVEAPASRRVAIAFEELAAAMYSKGAAANLASLSIASCNSALATPAGSSAPQPPAARRPAQASPAQRSWRVRGRLARPGLERA